MRVTACATILLAACTAGPLDPESPETGDLGQTSQPILNGAVDTGDPAVVLLYWSQGWICSGTLMSPKLVLTAGHCADGNLGTAPSQVFFGTDWYSGQGTKVTALKTVRHPNYANNLSSGGTVENDIAIVVLNNPVTNVTPVRPNFTTLTDAMVNGKSIRYVGFGKQNGTENAPIGVKEMVTVVGKFITNQNLSAGTATCSGDSGGPAFMNIAGKQVNVGITSWGPTSCIDASVSQRTDIHKDWITSIEAQYDPPACTTDQRCASGCTTPDPDCRCLSDGICSTGCVDPDPDCGDACLAEGHCLADCPVRDPDCGTPKAEGDICAKDIECDTGFACVRLDEQAMAVCAQKCGSGLAACGEGEQCEELAGTKPALSICKATAAGGCAVTSTTPSSGTGVGFGGALFALLVGAITLAGRRARPRR